MKRFASILLMSFLLLTSCQQSDLPSESRSPGEVAFRSNCQTCHILPKASMKTDDEWPAMVNRYGEKAKLTVTQVNDIIAYLTANN